MSPQKQNPRITRQKAKQEVPVRQRDRGYRTSKGTEKTGLSRYQLTDFLPTTKKEVELRGWEQLDIILFSGDAYIDHPAFGAAVIGRTLEAAGYKVAIVPQPDWHGDFRDFKKLGRPRLYFGIAPGAMDSMVNKYTANRRLRSEDAYSPDGRHDLRPEYPSIVYANILRHLYPDVPIILGGIEASLRRLTHYDYWKDCLRKCILCDAHADMIIYGMGEKQVVSIAKELENGVSVKDLKYIPQTVYLCKEPDIPGGIKEEDIVLHSHEACLHNKKYQAENFRYIEEESNKKHAHRILQAVDNVGFTITRGRTFGLVGESGSGKSTVARMVAGLLKPDSGRIVFEGVDRWSRDAARLPAEQRLALRRRCQMIFQDPYASLNPRWRVARLIAEPLHVLGLATDRDEIEARVIDMLRHVRMSPDDARKYPHQFSGGQRQRIAIARALISQPDFIICDEPTSALDVSVQAQVLNLMRDLQDEYGLTYLLISHDLAVIRFMCDDIGVMQQGRMVEQGRAQAVLDDPQDPYTRQLLAAIPSLGV